MDVSFVTWVHLHFVLPVLVAWYCIRQTTPTPHAHPTLITPPARVLGPHHLHTRTLLFGTCNRTRFQGEKIFLVFVKKKRSAGQSIGPTIGELNLLFKTECKTAIPPRLDTSSSNWYGLAVCGGIFFLAKQHMMCSFYGSKLKLSDVLMAVFFFRVPTESRPYGGEKRRRYTLLSIANHC